jgi:poly [ADP-ribose] polymerase
MPGTRKAKPKAKSVTPKPTKQAKTTKAQTRIPAKADKKSIVQKVAPKKKTVAQKAKTAPIVAKAVQAQAVTRGKRGRNASPVPAASPPAKKQQKTQVAKPVKPAVSTTSPQPVTAPASDTKMVTQLKKGRAAVDQECPQDKTCHVFDDKVKVWTATLNQTSLTKNANKYYIIQLLQSDTEANKFWVWNRWGRVGYQGQCALKGPFGDLNRAKNEFDSKLRDKTRGGYVELEIVYEEEEEKKQEPAKKKTGKTDKKAPAEKLDRRVEDLVRLIFDLNMINKALAEIGYDAKKMPLGKLSQGNLKRGYEVLKQIEDVLNKKTTGDLGALSGQFYSLIPHDFGFQHMSQFAINTKQRLKEKIDMIESLAEMKIATNMLAVRVM